MDESIRKAIRNGIYGLIITSIISFGFGIYDFIIGYEKFSVFALFETFAGAILASVPIFFIVFVISLIYFYFKTKE